MSRKKAGKTREAQIAKSRKRRQVQNQASLQKYGLTVQQATTGNIQKVHQARKRQQAKYDDAVEAYDKILAQAKLLAVTAVDFEYCSFSARTPQAKEVFQRGLQACLKKYVGQDVPDEAVDDAIHDYSAQMIETGVLIPAAVQLGMVPKARKYVSGQIEVLRRGDPDYDFLVELLHQRQGENDGKSSQDKESEVQKG